MVLAAQAAHHSAQAPVQAGLLAFLIVAAMGAALVFLLRSMNKQFRKLGPGDKDMPG
jgi:hypothetical protein